MNLTAEQKLAINMMVAQDMGIYSKLLQSIPHNDLEAIVTSSSGKTFNIFDPDNTTDLNRAMEFYKLYVLPPVIAFRDSWVCGGEHILSHTDESRDLSMRKAVIAVSGTNQRIEDE